MIVDQVWTGNAYRNFNYLIVCPESGEAMAVDPLDHEKCLAAAKKNGWTITHVLNTHEHFDHTGGNAAVVAATGAKVLAHANAKEAIEGMDVGLNAGDVIKVDGNQGFDHIDLRSYSIDDATFQRGSILLHSKIESSEEGERLPDPITIRYHGVSFAIFKGEVRVEL